MRIEDIKKEIKVLELRKTITKTNEMVWLRKENGGKWTAGNQEERTTEKAMA